MAFPPAPASRRPLHPATGETVSVAALRRLTAAAFDGVQVAHLRVAVSASSASPQTISHDITFSRHGGYAVVSDVVDYGAVKVHLVIDEPPQAGDWRWYAAFERAGASMIPLRWSRAGWGDGSAQDRLLGATASFVAHVLHDPYGLQLLPPGATLRCVGTTNVGGVASATFAAEGTFPSTEALAQAWGRPASDVGPWLVDVPEHEVVSTLVIAAEALLPLRFTQVVRTDGGERRLLDVEYLTWDAVTPPLPPRDDEIFDWETVSRGFAG